jgi:transposase
MVSQSALGAYYRRICARMDKAKAVTAAAHKQARLIYAMLTHGQEYTDRGQDYFEERYRQRVLHNLAQKAKAMGMQLIPSNNAA